MTCMPIPIVDFSLVSSHSSSVGSRVSYRCQDGHRFSNNKEQITMECTGNRTWNDTIPDCEGILRMQLCIISFKYKIH